MSLSSPFGGPVSAIAEFDDGEGDGVSDTETLCVVEAGGGFGVG